MDAQEIECRSACSRDRKRLGFQRDFTQAPQGLEHDGNNDRLYAVEQPLGFRQLAESNIGPGNRSDDEHRRKDETTAGHQQARPTGASMADVNSHLGGVWTGNQVGRAK